MPETTFLHIQSRGRESARVVELPGVSVRIGASAHCEVQLGEPGLADVQCLLRRRGASWHVQPVGPAGPISLEGRPVDAQRPLPLGVPLRVGDHWLTLRPAAADWGAATGPSPREPGLPEPTAGPEPTAPEVDPAERPAPEADPEGDRLARWEARLEQRERWLRDRVEERRWEARWKAAGASLRARSTEPSATPAPDSTHRRPAPTPPPAPTPRRPSPGPTPTPRAVRPEPLAAAIAAPARARTVARPEPTPARPESTVPRPTPAPIEPTPAPARMLTLSGPMLADPEDGADAVGVAVAIEFEVASIEVEAESVTAPAVAPEPEPAAIEIVAEVQIDAGPSAASTAVIEVEAVADTPAEATPTPAADASVASTEWLEAVAADDAIVEEVAAKAEPEPVVAAPEAEAVVESAEPAAEVAESVPAELPVDWSSGAPFVTDTAGAGPSAGFSAFGWDGTSTPTDDEPTEPTTRRAPVDASAWPSARAILSALGEPGVADEGPARAARKPRPARSASRPRPTEDRAPGRWALPVWLAWPVATAAAALASAVGLGLAWQWGMEARAAGIVADRLARGETQRAADLEALATPEVAWWKTAPGHLLHWAVALDRTEADPYHVRDLLDAAQAASPVHAAVRFARARPPRDGGGPPPLALAAGLSRDVASLAWTGRRLAEAGRVEPAARAYRSALEMAVRVETRLLGHPGFLDDPQVRRYALPYEDLVGSIVREMAECPAWTFAEWSPALPDEPVVLLAAARALRARDDSAGADQTLQRVVRETEADVEVEPPAGPAGATWSVRVAARAEALALLRDWSAAEAAYRLAVERMPEGRFRRSWYYNLAELYAYNRLNEPGPRRKALESAKVGDPGDEITRRAVEAQIYDGSRPDRRTAMGTPGPRG